MDTQTPAAVPAIDVRDIVKKFNGEPLGVLSISLDDDESKWKEFVTKNEMTWNQCPSEAGFKGPVAQLFGVHEIPNTSPSTPTESCKTSRSATFPSMAS